MTHPGISFLMNLEESANNRRQPLVEQADVQVANYPRHTVRRKTVA